MTGPESLNTETIDRLTADPGLWVSCEECFDELDVAVETAMTSPGSLSEQFRDHLTHCAACGEEARSLAEVVAGDLHLSPTQARARLEAALDRTSVQPDS